MRAIILAVLLTACGTAYQTDGDAPEQPGPDEDSKIEELERKILALQGTTAEISGLINSDYKTCPASGDTADPLIRKICQVAQAATVELQVELTSKLAGFADELTAKLEAVNNNLVTLQASDENIQSQIDSINTSLTTINSTLTALDTRLDNAEAAIDALETLTAGLGAAVAGAMEMVEIGTENVAAGPFHELVLRRTDKTRINAYIEAYGSWQGLGSNPLTATNGSASIVVALTAHGYTVGDIIEFTGLAGGRGFSNGHILGRFTVAAVTANTFTFTATKNATSSGTLGGTLGSVREIFGEGMGTVWETADGADVAVRQTSLGKPYNFIVQADGDICYDKTNASANFATINTGGVNITCK